jgi:ABC-type molybdate transport system substrate-binding protein
VITELGIEDSVRPKLKIKAAINGGAELVAKGEADVGMYLLSEVQSAKGVKVVGLLPAPVQSFVTYGSAIPSYNGNLDPALAFLKFVADPSQREQWTKTGFELLSVVPQSN